MKGGDHEGGGGQGRIGWRIKVNRVEDGCEQGRGEGGQWGGVSRAEEGWTGWGKMDRVGRDQVERDGHSWRGGQGGERWEKVDRVGKCGQGWERWTGGESWIG